MMTGSLVVRVLSIICEFHLELCLLYKDLFCGEKLLSFCLRAAVVLFMLLQLSCVPDLQVGIEILQGIPGIAKPVHLVYCK